ncbi:MAG: molecular chaperone HtpG [Eubacteriales bacterium]|jgi:molecular chaperone HtpG|nr:molecular chaperone HtpG [Eubacteriales bacterium]
MSYKGTIKVNTQNIFPIIKKWLYSDKDIFLRELVVNAGDAITKLKKLSSLGEASFEETPRIDVICDSESKTITIIDNGIGMTRDEVERYITQIAFSGAEEFIQKYKDDKEENQIIGHFGLGFYSAFMVADKVELETKSYKDEPAVLWTSDGGIEYTLSESKKANRGTKITLHISEDNKDFLLKERLRSILLKYCGYLPYEIYLDNEDKCVNDTEPLWTVAPSECDSKDYIEFYHKNFSDFNDPLFWVHLNVEYPFRLKGILYFPKLTHEFESAQGKIMLYNNQVYVADNIKEVIPEFLMLLKGIIDCPDIPLNVSRSALQNDGTVSKIASHITRKVADRLVSLHKNNKDDYDKYWTDIAPFIEYGCMQDEKFYEKLKPVMQAKTTDGEYISLVDFAKENDNKITYVTSEDHQAQYIKMIKEEGKKALIMPHIIDVHFISFLESKEGWKFTRIDSMPEQTADDETYTQIFKKALGKDDLKITTSPLKTDIPAIIVQEEQIRRMSDIGRMFGQAKLPDIFTLVLNSQSKVIKRLSELEGEKQELLCKQIYDIARLSNGMLSSDEVNEFIERTAKIMEFSL